jgi:hypothetical protein
VNNTQRCKRDLGARDRDLWLSTREETLQKFSETETFDLGFDRDETEMFFFETLSSDR